MMMNMIIMRKVATTTFKPGFGRRISDNNNNFRPKRSRHINTIKRPRDIVIQRW
jgi:hypothetical protein